MANELLQKVGTQIRFFVVGSFDVTDEGTNWTIGTPENVVLTLSAVAAAAGRQSTKVDLGDRRAAAYEVLGCVNFENQTPTAGGVIDYYWAPSTSDTPAKGNVAGNSGIDGVAPAGALGSITLAEFLLQCIFIGSLVITNDATVQNGFVGVFSPTGRYGQLIVVNNSSDPFETSNAEHHQVMNPIVDEAQ